MYKLADFYQTPNFNPITTDIDTLVEILVSRYQPFATEFTDGIIARPGESLAEAYNNSLPCDYPVFYDGPDDDLKLLVWPEAIEEIETIEAIENKME
jgi:hypothetical protein